MHVATPQGKMEHRYKCYLFNISKEKELLLSKSLELPEIAYKYTTSWNSSFFENDKIQTNFLSIINLTKNS